MCRPESKTRAVDMGREVAGTTRSRHWFHVAIRVVRWDFARVGIPEEILTDQGSNFTSQLLMELYKMLHVHPMRTSPYHPQTDGLVERFNQTLKAMLRKAAIEEGKDWDKMIPYLLFAYRGPTGINRVFTI